jgi:endonuclease/exonuclease/phosphatase family metal-dependent hydrolase
MTIPLRIATFNLENLDWSRTHQTEFEKRMAVLRPTMNGLSADIICLQEVDAQRLPLHEERQFLALDRLLCDTEYQGYQRATSVRPSTHAPADVHNLVILSRWQIIEHRQVHHDIVEKWKWTPPGESTLPQPPIEITWERPLLYAKILGPSGAALHICNLHLRAPRPVPILASERRTNAVSGRAWAEGQFVAAQKREGQALEARLFIESLFNTEPTALIAVCGDLNSEEFDVPARLLAGGPEEDAAEISPRKLIPLTARVAKERRFSVVHAKRRILLDHVLVSEKLAACCKTVAILNEDVRDEVTAKEPILGSLHAPIVASFDLGKS